jgi:hypothetical protein
MRKHDEGCFVRVTVSRREVETFASRWPCFGPRRAMSFTFDKRNGDLVDVTGEVESHDGHGIVALSNDAQAYAGIVR